MNQNIFKNSKIIPWTKKDLFFSNLLSCVCNRKQKKKNVVTQSLMPQILLVLKEHCFRNNLNIDVSYKQ